MNNGSRSLGNPSRLKPIVEEGDDEIIKVVIETPKGSRNKYAFDPEERIFALKKVLPAGSHSLRFGFVPSTKADDGEPTDVLVLMDEAAFPGCVLKCRLIGVIEGEQGDEKEKERNDQVIAIEVENHSWAAVKHVDDLGKKFLKELEQFFVNYHQLSGKEYKFIDVKGPGAARKCVKAGMKAGKKS